MYTRLASLICVVGLLLGLSVSVPASTPVGAVMGGNVACDPALVGCQAVPLIMSIMCGPAAGCPLLSAPSWTSSSRFWGSLTGTLCATSTDGGTTWAACTTQPFTSGAKEHYAGAADGSVIAVAQVGGNCVIKRSTDNAANWSTVFTYATSAGCGGASTGGTLLKCLNTGVCVMPFPNTATQVCHVLQSTDSGATWSAGTTSPACLTGASSASAYDGTRGIVANQNANGTDAWFTITGFAGWSQSASWPGTVGNCWGAVNYNGAPHAICFNTIDYTMRSTAGAIDATLVLPGAVKAVDNGGLAISLATNNLYVVASVNDPPAGTPIGVWITRDGGTTFNLLNQTSGAAGGIREGDIFFANGCIYWSGGTTKVFAKVCA